MLSLIILMVDGRTKETLLFWCHVIIHCASNHIITCGLIFFNLIENVIYGDNHNTKNYLLQLPFVKFSLFCCLETSSSKCVVDVLKNFRVLWSPAPYMRWMLSILEISSSAPDCNHSVFRRIYEFTTWAPVFSMLISISIPFFKLSGT